jgi:stage IV sporulation protein FB
VFFEPQPTQFDLRWRMLGVDVRVHPWFWLMSALMGWSWFHRGVLYLILWIGCVFVSVLIHEFGHIFMGRVFGAQGHVVLYSLGGLAVGSNQLYRHWQRILVSLAGPAAGFLFFGLVWLCWNSFAPAHPTFNALVTYRFLKWINLGWGFVNLLPIWPLDGGQVSRDLLDWWLPRRGVRIALTISIVTAGLLALNALYVELLDRSPVDYLPRIPYLDMLGGWWLALLFGSLAFNSFQALQMELRRAPWEHDPDDWRR